MKKVIIIMSVVSCIFSGGQFALSFDFIPSGMLLIMFSSVLLILFRKRSQLIIPISISSIVIAFLLLMDFLFGSKIAIGEVISYFMVIFSMLCAVYPESVPDKHVMEYYIKVMLFIVIVSIFPYVYFHFIRSVDVFIYNPFLYDLSGRFSSFFAEPSYLVVFIGFLFFYSISKKSIGTFAFAIFLCLINRSKFLLFLFIVLVICFLAGMVKSSKHRLFVFDAFIVFVFIIPIMLSINDFDVCFLNWLVDLIGLAPAETFITRLSLITIPMKEMLSYPFGTGLFGYRALYADALSSQIANLQSNPIEIQGYLDDSYSLAYSSKSFMGFVLSSSGFIGFVFYLLFNLALIHRYKSSTAEQGMVLMLALLSVLVMKSQYIMVVGYLALASRIYNEKNV